MLNREDFRADCSGQSVGVGGPCTILCCCFLSARRVIRASQRAQASSQPWTLCTCCALCARTFQPACKVRARSASGGWDLSEPRWGLRGKVAAGMNHHLLCHRPDSRGVGRQAGPQVVCILPSEQSRQNQRIPEGSSARLLSSQRVCA